MKKIVVIVLMMGVIHVNAQNLKSLFNKALIGDSSKQQNTLNNLLKSGTTNKGLSTTDISAGLKEALQVGTKRGVEKISAVDGFFKDAAIKILLPPEAQKVEKTLRSMGLNKPVDDAILSMNRAAEDAAKSATPIFMNAIQQITFQDAVGILKGSDSAATKYLHEKTALPLTNAFKPIVQKSLATTDATKYWETMITTYNKIPFVKKMNTDLPAYVTDKALSGIFYQVAQEEQKIRKDPVAQTTDLLKKVFGK